MSKTICYISKASENLNDKDINDLFEQVNIFNNAKNIRGILLYNFGVFFQILEGEKQSIDDLFHNQITLDMRHSDIFIIIEKEYPSSVFKEYGSKFNTVKDPEDLKKVIDYLDNNKLNSTHQKFKRLLDPFLLSMED